MPKRPRATLQTGSSRTAANSQKATMSKDGKFSFEDMDVEPINTQRQNISERLGMTITRKP